MVNISMIYLGYWLPGVAQGGVQDISSTIV